MSIVPTKTPLVVRKMFPQYMWHISTSKPVIYLTFDDGPTPEITEWVLEQLNNYNAKATFFCIGNNVKKYPDIVKKILKNGHSIGNHTHNHLKGWKTKTTAYVKNVETAKSVLDEHNCETNLFRPPYGRIKPKQANQLISKGYNIVMWDVLSFDWDANVTHEKCLDNIIKNTLKGSIVVFHDSLKASKNLKFVLPKVLEYYSQKDYSFKALDIKDIA